ncbi:hypothetical protein [Streptosporangium sp. NPDC002524]|uniref:hypothetical protein n=1 Tax=Streptosporangium sp. NPDC002524 TaxID=3154537 RepID=UPI003318BEDB
MELFAAPPAVVVVKQQMTQLVQDDVTLVQRGFAANITQKISCLRLYVETARRTADGRHGDQTDTAGSPFFHTTDKNIQIEGIG